MLNKSKIAVFAFILLVNACKKKEITISNLNGNKITGLGHGGMGIASTYSINSFESITKCLSLGADGSECDVQMTKDSVLVLFHDENLSDKTDLSGIIHASNWNDIKNAKYTATPYLNYTIISLEQLLSGTTNLNDYVFTFDCKLYSTNENTEFYKIYIRALIKTIEKFGLDRRQFCIESQNSEFLKLFKQIKPDWSLFIYPSSFDEGLRIATDLNLYGITISNQKISKDQIQLAHDKNFRVALWNVQSSSDNYDAIKKNPDYIQTDKLRDLIRSLR
jgi:glycerophosphoryl diester phosphodiesterase